MNDETGHPPASAPPESTPAFNPVRLLVWCSLTLGGSAAIVWVSWFTSGPMSWPLRFVWWTLVLGSLWLVARRARRFLESQGWSTDDAPPSEHTLRGAALIGGIVLSTALLGSTAGRQMVLSAADAVPGVHVPGTDGPTVITLPPTTTPVLSPPTTTATEITVPAVDTTAVTDTTTPTEATAAPDTAVPTDTTVPADTTVPTDTTATGAPGIIRGDDAVIVPGQPVVIAVLANDDPGFLPASVTIVVEPPGTAVVNPDGTITVTLDAGVTGTQSFVYRACTVAGSCQNGVVRILGA